MDKRIFCIRDFKRISDKEKDRFYISGYANNKDIEDDYGDIPKGNNVYDLVRYNKNPVILADHNNSVEGIIGTMVSLKENKKGLKFRALFMNNPQSDIAAHAIQAIKEGHLRALSIGGKWFYEDKKNPNVLTRAKIYEISFVAIPADSNALTNSNIPKKIIDTYDINVLKKYIKAIRKSKY